jgi:hypothetical protein
LISWKHSFKEISEDLELTKKKKQALDDLLEEGRISESTYESLNGELTGAITSIEARRKALADKVNSKIGELEQQITVLEMFLASSEIGYAAGEIDEDLHQRESNAFALGLEAIKQELNAVKEVVGDLMPGEPEEAAPLSPTSEVTEVTEEPQREEVVEEPPEIAVEPLPEPETVSEEAPVEQLMETPAEKPFVEEPVEMPHEALPEVSPEVPPELPPEMAPEEAPVEEEEPLPSEEFAEEPAEETAEEVVETAEVAEEPVVVEVSNEEEATTEEQYEEEEYTDYSD